MHPRLTLQQEAFCQFYADPKSQCFGNGTEAYCKAFTDTSRSSARRSASNLLTNTDVLDRISGLVKLEGLNDTFVDQQLHFLIRQNGDLSTKLGAIREYNKLRMRIVHRMEAQVIGPTIYTPQKLPDNYSRHESR